MRQSKTLKLTQITMLLAMGIVLHFLEPEVPVPVGRFRVGLANIIGIIVLQLFSEKEMLSVNVLRVILATLLSGQFLGSTFWISMTGVLLSTLVVILTNKLLHPSLIMLSILGAIFHTLGQLMVVSFYYQSMSVMLMAPYLLLLSIAAGYGTGFIANQALKYVKVK